MALFPGLPGWASTRKVKPIWILLEQEIVSGSGISWAICKSPPISRQITTPAPHHSVFYRLYALPAAQPTASEHWSTVSVLLSKISNCWCCSHKTLGRVCVTIAYPSICVVSHRLTAAAGTSGRFAAEDSVGACSRYPLVAVGECGQCHVESCGTRLITDLFCLV